MPTSASLAILALLCNGHNSFRLISLDILCCYFASYCCGFFYLKTSLSSSCKSNTGTYWMGVGTIMILFVMHSWKCFLLLGTRRGWAVRPWWCWRSTFTDTFECIGWPWNSICYLWSWSYNCLLWLTYTSI